MDDINPEFIERYQKMFEADPTSRIFAPLADAYRKMGMLKEALDVAEKGVKQHPTFPGGRVALGRIYFDLKKYQEAATELKTAVELSPENILAHSLLAECLLFLRKPKEALKAYKMLLFMSPENKKAERAVQKLESLTADEYEEEVFAMKPLSESVKIWEEPVIREDDLAALERAKENRKLKNLERYMSLADAYIVRNDVERVIQTLNDAEKLLGPHPDIVKRMKLVHQKQMDTMVVPKTAKELNKVPSREESALDSKIEFLQDLLHKIKNLDA